MSKRRASSAAFRFEDVGMTKKIEELEALMAQMNSERDELEQTVDGMIGEMADVPADQRKSGDWAPDGAATQRYLEKSERLAEVEQALIDLSRQLADARTSSD